MWTTDIGRCSQCDTQKAGLCPDAKIINKGLRKIQEEIEANEGGSCAGIIIACCNDTKKQQGVQTETVPEG